MKVAVSGATGFIGRHLVPALLARDDSVLALTRSPERARAILPTGVEIVYWKASPDGSTELSEALNGCDAVVNLSGEPVADKRWSELQKRKIQDSRVGSTNAIVEAIRDASSPPRVLVNGSAIGYYGSRGSEPLTEESAPGNDFLARVCVEWEAAARKAEEFGIRVVLLRTGGLVLGNGGGALPRLTLPFKLYGGGLMGPSRVLKKGRFLRRAGSGAGEWRKRAGEAGDARY